MPADTTSIFPAKEKLFANAFQYAAIGMALVSPEGRWLMVNKALCQLIGYGETELMSMTFQDITHPDDLEDDLSSVQRMLAGDIESYQMEKRYFHKNGEIIHVLLSVSLVRNDSGEPTFFISQIQDITERKNLEQELFKQATEDPLTGVCNRRQFFELAMREMLRGGRYREPMALLMLDIDHFKAINDTHGHAKGDEVLQGMARICTGALRGSDIFGRIGGEEFGVLLVNSDPMEAGAIAERLRVSIESMVVLADAERIRCSVSIGAVAFAGDELSLEHRLKQADTALYAAKKAGRNQVKLLNEVGTGPKGSGISKAFFLRFSWNAGYESGNEIIDRQHKHLFELTNRLLDGLMQGDDNQAASRILLYELVQHIETHFDTEEALLQDRKYPAAEQHVKIHQALRGTMQTILKKHQEGSLPIDELFEVLAKEVVSRHLLEEDVKFFNAIR